MYFVYILQCADDSYYVGSTERLEARIEEHNAGHGALYTLLRRPVALVYSEPVETLIEAVGRERQLKRWSHAKKQALVEGNAEALKSLSKRRKP